MSLHDVWPPPAWPFDVDCPKCQTTRRTFALFWPMECWICGEQRIAVRRLPMKEAPA